VVRLSSNEQEKEVNFLIEQLRKQSPDGIRAWLKSDESMIPVVSKHYKMIRMVLKMNPKLRKRLEELNFDMVKKNVCEVYPELEDDFNDQKVRIKVETEIQTIKRMLGVKV
jgi:hypothetical protein